MYIMLDGMYVTMSISSVLTGIYGPQINYNYNYNSFRKLLFEEAPIRNTVSARNKRGLIDILGYGLKYLFGTADARDVKRLVKVCDELHAFETKIVHATEH
jgi:hypothetical protein